MTSCDGQIGPDGCSGLAIVSKHKFTQVIRGKTNNPYLLLIAQMLQIEFFPYTDHGDLFWKDGEYFARKVKCEEEKARKKPL